MQIVAGNRENVRSSSPGESSGGQGSIISASDWRKTLRESLRTLPELLEAVGLTKLPEHLTAISIAGPSGAIDPAFAPLDAAAEQFRVLVPGPYLSRIERGNPADPLLLQVLPVAGEMSSPADFLTDPVGDRESERLPGLLQKYDGRALMILSGSCAVHCRYCFRRHYPYDETPRGLAGWQPAIDEIAADESVQEVILSGGDPLTIVDSTLAELAHRFAEIPHLKRLRVHSRVPVVIPERVNDELIGWMRGTRLAPYMVVHINHPREIDSAVAAALARMVDAGIVVMNQAVLLRGVNDNFEALHELCETLVNMRVLPYYLSQLDRVAGAAHFLVEESRGRELIEQLRASLPGYAIPRYVAEIPGRSSKSPL